jgi:lysine-N-methylase
MPPLVDSLALSRLAGTPLRIRPKPAQVIEVGTQAINRFACIGGACEDTCCRDLGVAVDPENAKQIRAAGASSKGDARTVRLVVLDAVHVEDTPQHIIRFDESGACPALDSDGLCGVHLHQGEAALSTACAIFPRSSLLIHDGNSDNDQLEVTGSLACPELARLALLAADGLAQTPSAARLLSRPYIGKILHTDGRDAFAAPFLQVRGVLIDLLSRTGFPISSRFAFAAHLAAKVDDFFTRDNAAFSGPGSLFARQRLNAEVTAATDANLLHSLHQDLTAFPENGGEAVMATTALMLAERRRLPHAKRFAQLVEACFRSLQAEVFGQALGDVDPNQTVSPAQLFAVYRRRKEFVDRRVHGLVDDIVGRYAVHYLLRHPYTDAPSLLNYLGRLGLALAAVRLLLAGSPSIQSCLAAAPNPSADAGVIADAAVEVVQILTKAVTHHWAFLETIHRARAEAGAMTFGQLVLFAKFV